MAAPTGTILDDFNRGDGAPGANWIELFQNPGGESVPLIVSQKLAAVAGTSSGAWVTSFAADQEVYFSLDIDPAAAYAWVRASGLHSGGACPDAGYVMAATGANLDLYKCDGAGGVTLITSNGGFTIRGMWLRAQGSSITGYIWNGAAWELVFNEIDTTFGSSGYIGFEIGGVGLNLDDFGGGALGAPPPPPPPPASPLLYYGSLPDMGAVESGATVAGVPVNSVAPAITGTPTVGQTLTCSSGTWSDMDTGTFAYQWKRGGSAITGATGYFYLLVAADSGATITCTVTATNTSGAGTPATSNSVVVAALSATVTGARATATATARSGSTPASSHTLSPLLPLLSIEVDVTNQPTNPTRAWTDITPLVRQLGFVRSGRSDELQRTSAGTLTALLDNRGDTLIGLRKGQWIRVRATWAGVIYPRWQGIVESLSREWPSAGKDSTITLEAVDVSKILRLYDLADQTFPAQRNDERVTALAVLTGVPLGSVDPGTDAADAITDPIPEGSDALSMLSDLEASENGLYIAGPDGTLTFQGRHWRLFNSSAAVASFGETPTTTIPYRDSVVFEDDDTRIANIVSVTTSTGVSFTTSDTASQTKYWKRRLNRTLASSDGNLALDAANYLVNRYKDPAARVPTISVDLAIVPDSLKPALLAARNSSRFLWKRMTSTGNQVTNPSFEVSTTGWSSFVNAGGTLNDFSRATSWSQFGVASAHFKWTQPADTTLRFGEIFTPGGTSGIPVTANASYTISAYVNTLDASQMASAWILEIVWIKSDGAASAITPVSNSPGFASNSTGRLSFTATAPADAAFAQLGILIGTNVANDVIEAYIDGVQFQQNSAATTYTAQAPISTDVFIEQIAESILPGPARWAMTFQLSPAADESAWLLGDAVYGVLDSMTKLSY